MLICASAVGCDARPALYGPIKQIASGHGCGATHWEENAPNPTTPKPNAARIINFVMGKPFCESGEPAAKNWPTGGVNTVTNVTKLLIFLRAN